jgi:hypothetical protein
MFELRQFKLRQFDLPPPWIKHLFTFAVIVAPGNQEISFIYAKKMIDLGPRASQQADAHPAQ